MTPQMEDKTCSNFGKIPLPPVMGAQFELITTAMVLAPLKRSVLEQLHVLIHENKRSNWFTIYLSLFILLHSVSLVTLDEIRYATKHGKEVRGSILHAHRQGRADQNCSSGYRMIHTWKKSMLGLRSCWPISIIATKAVSPSRWTGHLRRISRPPNSTLSRFNL
jgi:hypothetical protein